ncbi:hypothetical protein AQUCO_00201163v1 [Aquilegia coerulea]|uniref:C2H2-type domain-containing protein n=1 Tax=Aquilegia coerulea TaxID=218851 RepID=A0A2G5F6I9_AQUCA|nr:hypothetical protein AQUCO_00201163v1 [Aquilegia coerulea]
MAETKNHIKPSKKKYQKGEKKPSWAVVKSFLTRKNFQTGLLQQLQEKPNEESNKRWKKLGFSGSLCNNTKVMQRPETCTIDDNKKRASVVSCTSNGSVSSRSIKAPSNDLKRVIRSSSSSALSSSISSRSSAGGSYRGMPLGRFSGCYECRMVDDPSHGVSRRHSSIKESLCSCPVCGEIFMKPDALEVHQSVRHAVSELDPKDTSRNVVEIIFQSSWLKKQAPNCKIDRILKVNNSRKIITRFEDYTNSIKAKASKDPKKHPRCVADGNELLRFYCTTFCCSLGMNGSSNLCNLVPHCDICSIIRNGFKIEPEVGVCTSATSGKAHDSVTKISEGEKRAMLVCRVIAGRVKRKEDTGSEEFDSVAGHAGIYTDLEELFVFNPKSILPCFVVIYSGF